MRREYPLDPEYLEMLGRSYLALGDRRKALDFLQLSSRLKMPDLDGARLLGDLYEKEGAKGRAAEWLKKASKNDPRQASPEERCRIGLLLAGAQRGEEAVEWLSTLGERDAPYVEAQAALARLYQELGKPELALAACDTARKLRPQDGAVQLIAGRLYLDKKQLPQSTDAFSRASAIPGLESEGLAGLAEVAYASGDLEGALRSYQKALEARPGEEKLLVAIRELRAELKLRNDAGARARTTREGDKS
jgi:tetratricopeptide (TPR) repeat protein